MGTAAASGVEFRWKARRSWPYSVLLMLVVACSGRPVPPRTAPAGSAIERDAVIEGRRLRYALHLAPQPNLIYHLDCIAGVALCAQVIYRELWSTFAMSGEDEAALATWKAVRGRHAGELRTVDPRRPPQPLLAPSRVFDLAERQRIVGLRARTPAEYQATIALLATDADARELRQIVEKFTPRFLRWWQQRGFAAGSTSFEGFAKLLADPFLDATIQKAAQFYEADLPPGTTFQIHLLVQPASSRKLSVAYQLEGDSVVETPEGEKPEERIDIVAHELFHYLFFRMDPKRQAAMLESVCGSDEPLSAVAFGMLDEAMATALGNGVVGQHYQPPDAFAKQLARGLTRNRATASVARAIFPSMSSFLDRGTTVSSDEFLRAFNRATKATFTDGRPRPIDYLHSPVLIADGRFASAAQRLRDASYAGFPSLREFAALDDEAKTFLKEHPFISVAVLVPDAAGTLLESLGLADRHGAAVSSVAARTRGFVYALPRTAKSYAFVFVAGDSKTMDDLVDRFAASAELVPGHEGVLVELAR
ncbi:MAG TPA: hypothetical protein VK540_20840 [Polyangiaceae bacterium]|nr:hypothetical protein [Polyangiaceae bacterium]